jgi:hypothetical protein
MRVLGSFHFRRLAGEILHCKGLGFSLLRNLCNKDAWQNVLDQLLKTPLSEDAHKTKDRQQDKRTSPFANCSLERLAYCSSH